MLLATIIAITCDIIHTCTCNIANSEKNINLSIGSHLNSLKKRLNSATYVVMLTNESRKEFKPYKKLEISTKHKLPL